MSDPQALTCPWCGAPLPRVEAGQPFVTCGYCAATASLSGVRAVKAEPGHAPPATAVCASPELKRHVIATFEAKLQAGASAFDALVAAAQERLGALGQTEAFARVCIALLRDFDAANNTQTAADPLCVGRMIEVYLTAIEEVRTTGAYEFNMPFFSATPEGPKHFARRLSAEVIAELAARDPNARPVRGSGPAPIAGPAEPAAEPAGVKKKWYWPFG